MLRKLSTFGVALFLQTASPTTVHAATPASAQKTTNHPNAIFIIAGPGRAAFNSQNVKKLSDGFRLQNLNVEVIGDGETSVDLENLYEKFKNFSKNYNNVTVFIQAHGINKNGHHYIELENDKELPTELFLSKIASRSEGKTDFFFSSCYGGQLLSHLPENLKTGTHITVLSPSREVVTTYDIERMEGKLNSKIYPLKFHALDLLNIYLSGLKNKISPIFATVGPEKNTQICNLNGNFMSLIGQNISGDEKKKVEGRLSTIFSQEELNTAIREIKNSKSQYDVSAEDYGEALAVSGVIKCNL